MISLYLINLDNIFSFTDPKIKQHTQNIANSRLYQFTSHKNSVFQAYDFHLVSTKTIRTENPKATTEHYT